MRKLSHILIMSLVALFLSGYGSQAYSIQKEKPIIERNNHHISLADKKISIDIKKCQKPDYVSDAYDLGMLRQRVLTDLESNGCLSELRKHCVKYDQDLVVFNLTIISDTGEIAKADLVFPNKEETDSHIIRDKFLFSVFMTLKKHPVGSIGEILPYAQITFVINLNLK